MSNALLIEEESLAFKADFFPMTVIKLTNSDTKIIKSQLSASIASAPNYFKHAPIVIDLTELDSDKSLLDFTAICALLRSHEMIPVGVRGLDSTEEYIAIEENLAIIKTSKSSEKKETASLTSGSKEKTETKPPKKPTIKTKVITTPIRSGTQVYAKDADLIIIAAVNPGAECFADGNIHVYGPLRGKALAGASGNKNARIFCESLEAELVSIAGQYIANDQIKAPKKKKAMLQIYLKDDKIQIESI